MDDIAPANCRMCGGDASIWHNISHPRTALVRCRWCDSTGPKVTFKQDQYRPHIEAEMKAVKLWNEINQSNGIAQ